MLPLSGCYGTIAKRTADFSAQAAPTLVDVQGVYTTVEASYTQLKLSEAVAAYDRTAFDPKKLKWQFGSDADLAARKAVLDLLTSYVEALAEVSGAKPLAALDAPSNAAGDAIASAAKDGQSVLFGGPVEVSTSTTNPAGQTVTSSKTVTPGVSVSAGEVTSAIEALGKVMVERERARELPKILEAADGPVATLCELLRRDIGNDKAGLLFVLRNDYDGMETNADAAIRDHAKEYSYPEKQTAVAALFGLVGEEQAKEAALVSADEALLKLEQTHAALAKSAREKDAPGFRAKLSELVAEGRELASAEDAAGKSGGK